MSENENETGGDGRETVFDAPMGAPTEAETVTLPDLAAKVALLTEVVELQREQIELLRLKTEAMRGHVRALAQTETVEDLWRNDA